MFCSVLSFDIIGTKVRKFSNLCKLKTPRGKKRGRAVHSLSVLRIVG